MRRALHRMIAGLAGSTRGATAVEYGLIVALIALAAIVGLRNLGGGTGAMWGNIANKAGAVL